MNMEAKSSTSGGDNRTSTLIEAYPDFIPWQIRRADSNLVMAVNTLLL